MDIKEIINKYSLPQNSIEVSIKSEDLINYQTFVDESNKGNDLSNKLPVVNNPSWVIECMTGEIYSGNDEGEIIKIPSNRRKVLFMEEGKKGLRTKTVLPLDKDKDAILRDYKNIRENKGDKDMELKGGLNSLGDLGSLELGGLNDPTEKMNVLSDATVEPVQEKGIKEDSESKFELSSCQVDLGDFNREFGALECLIVKNDHKVSFAATKEPASKKGNKSGAGADQGNQANKAMSTRNADSLKVLTLRDSKPSPIVGGILSIPEGGIFELSSVQSGFYTDINGVSKSVLPNRHNTDLKHIMMEKDELYATILVLFDKVIRGSKDTFGEAPGGVPYLYEVAVSPRTNVRTGAVTQYVRLIPPKKVPLVKDGSYFPLKTFKYLDVKDANEDEINYSAFAHLFKTSAKSGLSPYGNLKAEFKQLFDVSDKDKVTLNGVEVNKITSKIFTKNSFVDNGLQCKRWNSKDEFYENLPIPAKFPKQGKSTISPRLVSYSALSEDEYKNSALEREEFKSLVEKFPAQLNRGALLDVFKSGKASKNGSVNKRQSTTNENMFKYIKGNQIKLDSLRSLARQNEAR